MSQPSFFRRYRLPLGMAAFTLALHFAVNFAGGYGYFRDEFYYLACADHLDFGYVDHPPFSIAVLWLWRHLFGASLFALRALPALCGAAFVLLTGVIARELGGNRFAQGLAALAALIAPVFLSLTDFYSMNALDLVFWAVAALLMIRLINTERPSYWYALGAVFGVGLQNKLSVFWLGFGFVVGLLLTPQRKMLLTKAPYIAGAITALIFAPHLVWQIAHGWPTLEFMHNAAAFKMQSKSPLQFLSGQLLIQHPLNVPLSALGLFALFAVKPLKTFRLLAWMSLTVLLLLMLNATSRDYYFAPVYPILFAAGAVMVERLTETRSSGKTLRMIWAGTLLIVGAIAAPLAMPLLPVETYIKYADLLGMSPSSEEQLDIGALPQHFADRFGWPEMAKAVADVYRTLSKDEQQDAVIFARNYGEAGAIDFFGKQYGLPRAISPHNNYWFWGYGSGASKAVIVLGGKEEELQQAAATVERAAVFTCQYCMPYENNLPIYVLRGVKIPLDAIWQEEKHFI